MRPRMRSFTCPCPPTSSVRQRQASLFSQSRACFVPSDPMGTQKGPTCGGTSSMSEFLSTNCCSGRLPWGCCTAPPGLSPGSCSSTNALVIVGNTRVSLAAETPQRGIIEPWRQSHASALSLLSLRSPWTQLSPTDVLNYTHTIFLAPAHPSWLCQDTTMHFGRHTQGNFRNTHPSTASSAQRNITAEQLQLGRRCVCVHPDMHFNSRNA